MKRKLDLTKQESGQATIELILLLVITVIIILSLLYQFNQSFKSYSQAFFDGYIACLLETGELPGSGSQCQNEFTAYDPNAGKMLVKNKVPEPGGGNWGGQGGGNWEGQGGGNWGGQGGGNWGAGSGKGGTGGGNWGDKGTSGSSGGSEAVAGNSGPGEGSRSGAYGVGRYNGKFGRGRAVTPVGDASEAKNVSGLGGPDSLLGRPTSAAAGTLEKGSSRRGAIALGWGYYGDEEQRSKETFRPPVSPVTKKSAGNDGLRPTKARVDINRKPAAAKDMGSGGFSFSEIVKFLFIAALILAIVIFFGGQVMQVSKSWEK